MENKDQLFNTKSLMTNLNNVLENGVKELLKDFIDRYILLEETHKQILSLLSSTNNQPILKTEANKYNYEEELCYKKNVNLTLTEMTNVINELKQEIKELKSCKENPVLETILETEANPEIKIVNIIPQKEENVEEEHIILKIEEDESEIVKENEEEDDDEEEEEADEEEENDDEEEEEADEEEENDDEEADEKEEEEEADEEEESDEKEEADEKEEEEADEEEESDEKEKEEEEEADEELFEIEIDDVTYCTNDEVNGFIYELTEDGDVGKKQGYFKEGEPIFYNEK